MNEKNDENLKDEQTPENSDQKPSSEEPSADQQAGAEESATTGGRGEFHKNKKKSKNFAGSLIWVIVILAIASLAYYMTQKQ
ncbi:MAG: peptidoglycan-binding protein LysM, partial [Pediococcus pentosaceus]|nr:peptidoglycan-binding protein LysM [Pediococcus pentosaceus]MCI1397047.1 peptidoglycan-binding protein LysM [Pediococcus pentosaceus]